MGAVVDEVERPDLPEVNFDWDPETWEKAARRAVEAAIDVSTGWERRRPGPEGTPDQILKRFREPLPRSPVPFEAIADRLEELASFSTFIGHPRWFAYITSSPNPVGVVGDFVTSAINPNIGLWRGGPAATAIEVQSIEWLKELLGYPPEAEGVYTSGGQFANIVAHAVIRDQAAGWDVRRRGMNPGEGAPNLRIYASEEIHYSHQQAAELLGMGSEAVRLVPVDGTYRMRVDALARMIEEDRERGNRPIAIVATAGTVGTGAVDPIPELLRVARSQELWLHVDGAYGAFAAIAPSAPEALRAMRDADSIACDPHKWLYAPIDAGVVLVRNPGLLAASFAFHASYLHARPDTDGRVDLAELGPENSRRARGIKVWMATAGIRARRLPRHDRAQYPARGLHGTARAGRALSGAGCATGTLDRVLAGGAPRSSRGSARRAPGRGDRGVGATGHRHRVERAAAGRPDRTAGMHRQLPDEPGGRGSGGAGERGDRPGARRKRLTTPGLPRLSNRTVQGL